MAVLDRGYPQSVHLAYPNLNYQVEVYDPTPARAMQLVSDGQLVHFGDLTGKAAQSATGRPTAASVADLQALATSLGHPVYWAGPKEGYTYELTRTSNGNVYVRYLPPGTKVGDQRAGYLTVATYPFPNAFDAVARTGPGSSVLSLPNGGVAVVDGAYPRSIHLAYPGVDYQVEVYDPSPENARKVVAAGSIVPVS